MRQLSISLWFRTSGRDESLLMADEWTDRIETALHENFPPFDGNDVGEIGRLVLMAPLNSFRVTSSVLEPTVSFSRALKRRKNVIAGNSYREIRGVATISIDFDIGLIPADLRETAIGQELRLECALWALPNLAREAIYRIADNIASAHDLTYGQVGHAGRLPSLAEDHPAQLGPNQGWQMRQLRGYDWMIWVPPRLAAQMSAGHRAYANSHPFEVVEWETGLLRLRATDRPETFDESSLRHLFHSVAELLPDGPPEQFDDDDLLPASVKPMLVYEDARDHH